MIVSDFYLRTTRSKGSTVTYHRVWDSKRFMAAQQRDADAHNAKKPDEAYTVRPATEQEYKESRTAA